ncbi:copper resistance protein CopC [Actinotalea sp. BY-33]|uniref:Copper resistance protein CopC n=1 Tax=Actinotalea soli TaxID=2819234 RepID=A0A939RU91_9CELL|nr:copper resistance CopC family protein [Actinotalea soli]MBO1751045.1 copper resistance protein CopC [Actinotalea soli]
MTTARRLTLRTAATAGLLSALLLAPTTAYAHDELTGSTPAAEESLATPPEEIVLTYSAGILDLGNEVTVEAEGQDWAAGDPVVEGQEVTVPLTEGMPAGEYTITWRVVSSDGHPIEGVIPFSVEQGAAEPAEEEPAEGTEPPAATAEPTPEGTPTEEPAPSTEETATTEDEEESGAVWPWVLGIGAVVVVGGVVAWLVVRRRRTP